jgi:hypothetical protein
MRHMLSLILAGCLLQSVGADWQAPADQGFPTRNDVLAGALWRIAAATNSRIGFEASEHVKNLPRLDDTPPLSFSTLEDGLNASVGADTRYEWRKVGDFVVVRPIRAWDDPSNPFNLPIRGLKVVNEPAGGVLLGIRDLIYTNTFAVNDPKVGSRPMPVSFEVQAGTVVDVLNEMTLAADQVMWVASYRPLGLPGRWPEWDLSLELRDAKRSNAFSGSRPPGR